MFPMKGDKGPSSFWFSTFSWMTLTCLRPQVTPDQWQKCVDAFHVFIYPKGSFIDPLNASSACWSVSLPWHNAIEKQRKHVMKNRRELQLFTNRLKENNVESICEFRNISNLVLFLPLNTWEYIEEASNLHIHKFDRTQ